MNFLRFAALLVVVLYASAKACRALAPSFHGFTRGLLTAVAAVLVLGIFDAAYFHPRYGGYVGYVTDGLLAGSDTEALYGETGRLESALSIYYGDTNGKYPETLDVLWKDHRYLDAPPGPANVYVPQGSSFGHAHWYRDRAKIKYFSALADADDSGGWGYVNDPHSPDYGHVFVNCTHANFKTGVPWFLGRDVRIDKSLLPPPPKPALAAPVRETVHGTVFGGGMKPVADADITFTSEDGARTLSVKSGPSGRYGADLPPGRYRVTATHDGFKPYSTEKGFFVITPGKPSVGNIFLKP